VAGLVFESEAMFKVVSLAVQIAQADVPVLISGPNGAGKERIAEIVQANSRRKNKPFIKINAGALPENLIEAELFGAEAGAYTGLTKMRVGRFEAADQGTLFLDEVGNLSLAGQAKLLRVIQTGEFQRLGSSTSKRVDVRVVSATNVDLRAAIANKMFREDLYFRLNVIEIRVPPLSERKEDIIPIANQALAQFAKENQSEIAHLSEGAKRAMLAYHWPGNVRELQNRLFRASLLCQDREIMEADLDLSAPSGPQAPASVPPPAPTSHASRETAENDGERARIENALLAADGNVSKAAAELGLSRQALYRRMERLGLSLERRVKNERNS
jgi:DNA-binding NtrC family response regulator